MRRIAPPGLRGLENQLPQTNALQRLARAGGAVAASAFGAGFGGAVWAIIRADDAPAFSIAWLAAYAQEVPSRGGGVRDDDHPARSRPRYIHDPA